MTNVGMACADRDAASLWRHLTCSQTACTYMQVHAGPRAARHNGRVTRRRYLPDGPRVPGGPRFGVSRAALTAVLPSPGPQPGDARPGHGARAAREEGTPCANDFHPG